MNKIAVGMIVLLILSAPLFATTRVDLDSDWLFRIDPNQAGETSNWQKRPPPNANSVSVPHTWNLGRDEGYLGKAWYFKTLSKVPSRLLWNSCTGSRYPASPSICSIWG
jgi:beta-glucuronidase